jgi:hypothetical protein
MIPMNSGSVPIYPGYVAKLSEPRPFGTSPFRGGNPRGMRGGNAWAMRGYGGCGCDSGGGACSCSGLGAYDPGMAIYGPPRRGLGQNASLDQIISNAFNWLSGTVQANLPGSAAVPPQYGSTGALGTQLLQWAPWIIGGFLVYKLIK